MDVQDILKQLEVNDGTFPRESVAQAIEQREVMTPELLSILEHAHSNIQNIIDQEKYMAHIYAMYLLAQFRESRAYPLIVQFFSIPGRTSLDVTGEVVTEDLGRILASVSCGDIRLMTTLIENEQVNEYVRYAALQGLVTLVARGEQSREEVLVYFQRLFRDTLVREPSHVWHGLVFASTDLYPEEVYEDIKHAYEDDLVEPFFMQLEEVEKTLSYGKESVLNDLQKNRSYSLITDTISEMEWWACFRLQDLESRNVVPVGQPGNVAPVVHPSTKKPKRKGITAEESSVIK
jgi:hypothetical protein